MAKSFDETINSKARGLSTFQQVKLYFNNGQPVPPIEVFLQQGSQTRSPRAVCGPPNAFVWPMSISKTDKIINFDQI